MPLDVLGRTRATLTRQRVLPWPIGLGNLVNTCRARDRLLQLLILNEEFLVNASHQLALITSLPFVHTARRTYRLNDSVKLRTVSACLALSTQIDGNFFKPHHLEEGEVVTRFPRWTCGRIITHTKTHYHCECIPVWAASVFTLRL